MREKVTCRRTSLQWIAELAALLLVVGIFIYIIIIWDFIPDIIPGHYNAAGQVDRYDGKGAIWICPVMALVIYLIITLVQCIPGAWNTGVKLTKENRDRVLRLLMSMIIALKLEMALLFGFLTVCMADFRPLPIWFTPVFMLVLGVTLAYYIVRVYKQK